MRPVPRRNGPPGRSAASDRGGHADRLGLHRARVDRRRGAGDARRVDLRPRPNRVERRADGAAEAAAVRIAPGEMSIMSDAGMPLREIQLAIDGREVRVPEGTTILQACRTLAIETPTLCYLETLSPVNVCRVCVVEVEGSRVLVPACSRPV